MVDETENVVATETTTEQPTTETTNQEPVKTTESKPAGYDPIDPKTATPEETQARIDYIYRQLKPTQRENREMRQLLQQQSEVISRLEQGQNAVVNHLTQQSYTDSEAQLKAQMKDAWTKQDSAGYIEAQTKLNKLYAQQAVQGNIHPQQQTQQPQQKPKSAAEIAYNAQQTGELGPDEYRMTEAWQGEKDDSGRLVRPWAFDNDPMHQTALFEARSVMANPRYENWTYQQKLEEVDRRMGLSKRTASSTVIGGGLTKGGKSTKIELTPKQREIALKTKYAGKDKSEADHIEKFRKQIEKYSQKRF